MRHFLFRPVWTLKEQQLWPRLDAASEFNWYSRDADLLSLTAVSMLFFRVSLSLVLSRQQPNGKYEGFLRKNATEDREAVVLSLCQSKLPAAEKIPS
jgi:hypothetical protein